MGITVAKVCKLKGRNPVFAHCFVDIWISILKAKYVVNRVFPRTKEEEGQDFSENLVVLVWLDSLGIYRFGLDTGYDILNEFLDVKILWLETLSEYSAELDISPY